METRIALIGIIVENKESSEKINQVLHEYSEYIVGRMGIPYHKKQISVISVIVDASNEIISAMSGKLGMIPFVNTKTVYSKVTNQNEK
ncbi:MAG TPA: iron-only hydrogenase system regulator [Candidatus Cloacimonadota bacterium]|nr:iron-only hydrogenase system regulator [Candidatus Cloacimonadota bacterium]HOD54257.1 iron-only hydrogenase system regulator [Candidatus Cloacimonadota bacterium]HPM01296.1 iron-only hydrogenase system regulator [Candidatus Cloacimonadota bacterium]